MRNEKAFYWIKFKNAYTHRERNNLEKFMKEILKFQVNEVTNLGSVFLVKYIYMCIKFLMSQILCDN